MLRKTASVMLALIIILSMTAVNPVTTFADGSFQVEGGEPETDFTYESGLLTILTDTPLTISGSTTTDRIKVTDGVNANITLSDVSIEPIADYTCGFKIADNSTGNVSITLEGTNLLKSSTDFAGLEKNGVGGDVGTLTISGDGSLTAIGGENSAGIGGSYSGGGYSSNITIEGTTVTATGGYGGAGIGGGNLGGSSNIIIKGSTVIATGGVYAAGIGGGSGGSGSEITIDDGSNVTATGGEHGGAGIGGGKNGGSNITIIDSTVTATAGGATGSGAGIGGGGYSNIGSNITIRGSTVTAKGWGPGAGIGGGNSGGNVTIDGSTVTATGGSYSAGIGGGGYGSSGGNITIRGGNVTATGGSYGAGIGGIDGGAVSISGDAVVFVNGDASHSANDIGCGNGGFSDGTLEIFDTAAVFLYNGNGPVEKYVTCNDGHILSAPMSYDENLYGIALPVGWSAATNICAYVRPVELAYDANTGGGTVPSQKQHIGTTGTIQPGNSLYRTGYNLNGWNTEQYGEGMNYTPGDSFTFDTNTTLYAKWQPEEYTIHYTLNDGEVGEANPTSYDIEDTFTLNNPIKTGYDFTGWTSEGYNIPITTVTVGPGTIGHLSFIANWTGSTYTIAFNGEGVTVEPASKTVTYHSPYGTLPLPIKTGFNFAGWWTDSNGTGTQITSGNTVTTADNHTLYAKWTDKAVISIAQTVQSHTYDGTAKAFAITGISGFDGVSASDFTVTYNQGDGNISPVNPGSYNVEIMRGEDETFAQFSVTVENGLVINAAAVDIAAISGVTAPMRGAVPVSAIDETDQYTGTVTWKPSVTGTFAASTEYTATITLTPKTGYTLTGVTADFFIVTGATKYNNGADSGIITAVFPITSAASGVEGGGGSSKGSSSGGSPSSTVNNVTCEVTSDSGFHSTLQVTVDTNSRTASVDIGSKLLNKGRTAITIPSIHTADAYKVGIPVRELSTAREQGSLTLNTDVVSVAVPSNMLTGVAGMSESKAEISIGHGDKNGLPGNVKSALGEKPLVQLTLSIDGKQTRWSNPNAPITVSIPYTPTAEELVSPESIIVWYIDGSGNVVTIPNGRYDAATETVTFRTTHFSSYAVAYNKVSFNDVAASVWYNKAVSFIAARGITTGTGNGNYSPEAKLTRGEFIILIMRAYGISPEENPTDNFSDAGNTYYTGYLAAVKKLGISTGIENNMYAPGNHITRQRMFTLLYDMLKAIGQLPDGDSGRLISDFSDAGQINSWAKEAMMLLVETGTISGNGGKLNPTGTTTRAEIAQVLYNLLGK
ncbi:putative repeat protein (TIGR02543 family) [Anaerobacterium chartisolvens]|uniref:Putative repeat protein (TIGR02543 family) n=1 Tax=Anaerobacterium chartisolvens TaxID=1297424 RepID=A0A369B6L4_9FIRM|nr:S-layer homology domain-containing protein [Anaerobacterium chartisolvens]RCX17160.1 putative repeat protein (TIGR02543 family) [Anaerobacterium chartisolvens]